MSAEACLPRLWSPWPLWLHKVPRGAEGTGICLSWHEPSCLTWGPRKNDGSFFLLFFLFLPSSLKTQLTLEHHACGDAGFARVPWGSRGMSVHSKLQGMNHIFLVTKQRLQGMLHDDFTALPSVKTAESSILLFQHASLFTVSVVLFEIRTNAYFIYLLHEGPMRLEQNRM